MCLWNCRVREGLDGVVEEVVEKLLAQLLLDIVGEGVGM